MKAKKKILIVGGTGFIGYHLAKKAIKKGWLVASISSTKAKKIRNLKFKVGRLKTGTPPRLKKNSINWNLVEMQSADDNPIPFSYLTSKIEVPQIQCGITRTTSKTHAIIEENYLFITIFTAG